MESHTMTASRPASAEPDLPTEASCPVTRAVRVISGKWKLLIVFHLLDGTLRFGALQRRLPGVTQQMLTQQLRELEADGIVARKVYAEVPPKVEYSLTPLGRDLDGITQALSAWGARLPAA